MKIRHILTVLTAALIFLPLSIFPAQNNAIRVDMEGYRTESKKYVMLVGQNYTSFTVKRVSDNATVFTGTFAAPINDAASGDSVRIGDFSALTTQGEYYVQVTGLGESYNFRISDTVNNDVLIWLMRGFYSQRCGTSVSLTHRGTTFSHGACHLNDATYDSSTGLSGTKITTGGWHDAGDYGKYALNSGITMGELLMAFERYKDSLQFLNFGLSYSGGAMPDYLVECKYNLDWMLKMQHTNGGVFHKLSNGFPQGIMPTADTATRYIFQISSAATADFAAVMAIASRVYAPYDAAYAATCLTAAQNAWNFLSANPNIVPDGGFSGGLGGAYGDSDDRDERLWAAVELFNTTGAAVYNNYVASHYTDRTLTLMSDGGDDWKELHPLAYIGYMRSTQPTVNTTVVNAMKTAFQTHVNTFRTRVESTSGYKYVLNPGDYYWGSNSVALNRAIRLLAAADIFADPTYKDAAEETLHYMLGRNPMNKSYLTYVGEVYTSNPHHQPSIADGITPPWPGLLAGGPNEYYDSGSAPAKCYVDDAGNYTSNEIAINWMAAYAYVLAAFVPTPGPTNTPTNTPTSICYPVTCTFTNTYTPTMTATPINVLRVNVAGPQITTGGYTWLADKAYTAGSWGYNIAGTTADRTSLGAVVANTTDDMLYLTERWGSSLSYTFDLANGWYLVTLKFNEMFVTSAGARLFNINLEGQTVQSSFDVFAAAGNSQRYAVDRSYPVLVTDGKLNIDLNQVVEMCILNAIQIETYYPPTNTPTNTYTNTGTPTYTGTPTRTFTSTSTSVCYPYTCTFTNTSTFTATHTFTNTPVPTPIRVNCGGPQVTTGGFTWSADFGFTGGSTADAGAIAISNTTDDVLYQTERYGNPSYTFNVPNGYYNITFKFAETYWTSAGSRIMDVTVEGVTVIDNLDIYASAVAPKANTAYDVTINNILITDGQINIASSATADNAKFCAIAIIPAGPPPTSTYTNTLVPSSTYTASATYTRTNTSTSTYTYTATATYTATNTATDTQVPPTATNTYTSTSTRTFTATVTDTATQAPPTSTYTNTNTFTRTFTNTPTETYSSTQTFTNSATATITNTPPPGSTNTETVTSSNTATPTFTNTFTFTMTYTETQTWTASYTNTITYTPSNTITSGGPTLTFTHTFTATNTNTITFTNTSTNTHAPTSTYTDTFTQTITPSKTFTFTNTYTVTHTYTSAPANTFTPTYTAVFTATVTAVNETEKFKIIETIFYPNPYNPEKQQPVYMMFTCNRQVKKLGYRIYTVSFRLIREEEYDIPSPVNSGIVGISAEKLNKLANGAYYVQVNAVSVKGDSAKAKPRQLVILR